MAAVSDRLSGAVAFKALQPLDGRGSADRVMTTRRSAAHLFPSPPPRSPGRANLANTALPSPAGLRPASRLNQNLADSGIPIRFSPSAERSSSKVALVTGASGGIGAAIAQRLARDGFTVVVNYGGSAGPAEALVAKIESAGGRAVAAQADIADPAAVARLFDTAGAAFGGVDVVVNNVGVMQLATIAESEDALFDRQIAINLRGVFNTLREAARRLRAGGRIINISSSVTTLLQPT